VIAPEIKEQMIQDLMAQYKTQAVGIMVGKLEGVQAIDVIMAMPNVMAEVIQAITGLAGKDLIIKYDDEAFATEDNNWKFNTISHSLYRLLNEMRVVAAAAAYNVASKKVEEQDENRPNQT
jgi:hypothetical protein